MDHIRHPSSRRAFTLIELLIVIAVIAVLAIVVVLVLNPAELLKQSRDSNRVSDMDTLTHALSLYQGDQGGSSGYTMGNASSVYVSLPDSSSTCGSWGLPALPSGYTYQCVSSQNLRNVDGTGWIPVPLTSVTTGAPLGSLPVDPTNSSSTGLYYTYYANGSQYEVTSLFESSKYKAQYAANPINPSYPEVDTKGSSITVSPLFNSSGLVGYWPMDEGSGSSTIDASGNGNGGTWNGTTTNGSYYTGGKVGPSAGVFNGSNDYVNVPDNASLDFSGTQPFTISAWVYQAVTTSYAPVITKGNSGGSPYNYALITNSTNPQARFNIYNGSAHGPNASGMETLNAWHLWTGTFDGATMTLYVDGVLSGTPLNISSTLPISNTNALQMGRNASAQAWNGDIDDVRIYNRALSAAEIAALYNAEK
jgi:prepilin-type N-terminal cleavage/methylation domain-containing protein